MQHVRDVRQVQVEGLQIVLEVHKALDVLLHLFVLRIRHENDSVHAAQHQLPCRVVDDLTRHGVKLELRFKAFDRQRLDGQKVEEERSIRTGRERNELAFVAVGGLNVVVHLDQVGGLAAEGGTVIHDLDLQFLGCLINYGHKSSYLVCRLNSRAMSVNSYKGKDVSGLDKTAK